MLGVELEDGGSIKGGRVLLPPCRNYAAKIITLNLFTHTLRLNTLFQIDCLVLDNQFAPYHSQNLSFENITYFFIEFIKTSFKNRHFLPFRFFLNCIIEHTKEISFFFIFQCLLLYICNMKLKVHM